MMFRGAEIRFCLNMEWTEWKDKKLDKPAHFFPSVKSHISPILLLLLSACFVHTASQLYFTHG